MGAFLPLHNVEGRDGCALRISGVLSLTDASRYSKASNVRLKMFVTWWPVLTDRGSEATVTD